MNYTEVMHILQAIRNTSQLNGTLGRLPRDQVVMYELSAVCMWIFPDELVDVSVFHPLRNQRKPVLV